MKNKKSAEWHFDFGIFGTGPKQLIPSTKCEELMEVIIRWAESNNLKIGGGYREYSHERKVSNH